MTKDSFIEGLKNQTNSFQNTMDFIEENFEFTPIAFTVGEQVNELGSNQGSAKILCLGKVLALSEPEVLQCFGDFYRKDVLDHPDAADHQNIRNFIKHGWSGVEIDATALTPKAN